MHIPLEKSKNVLLYNCLDSTMVVLSKQLHTITHVLTKRNPKKNSVPVSNSQSVICNSLLTFHKSFFKKNEENRELK